MVNDVSIGLKESVEIQMICEKTWDVDSPCKITLQSREIWKKILYCNNFGEFFWWCGTKSLVKPFLHVQNVYQDNSLTLNKLKLTLHSSFLALCYHERKLSSQDVTHCHMEEIRDFWKPIKKSSVKVSGHSIYNLPISSKLFEVFSETHNKKGSFGILLW